MYYFFVGRRTNKQTNIESRLSAHSSYGYQASDNDDFEFLLHIDINTLSHDYFLLLDTNLLSYIETKSSDHQGWVQWFSDHVQMGQCFVTPYVAREYGKPLPNGIILIQSTNFC